MCDKNLLLIKGGWSQAATAHSIWFQWHRNQGWLWSSVPGRAVLPVVLSDPEQPEPFTGPAASRMGSTALLAWCEITASLQVGILNQKGGKLSLSKRKLILHVLYVPQSYHGADGGVPGGWTGQPSSLCSDQWRAPPLQSQPGSSWSKGLGLPPWLSSGGCGWDHPQRPHLSWHLRADIRPYPLTPEWEQLEDKVCQPKDQRTGCHWRGRDSSTCFKLQLQWTAASLQLMAASIKLLIFYTILHRDGLIDYACIT